MGHLVAMRRPKQPTKRFPGIQPMWSEERWKWRSRNKVDGISVVGSYRDSQEDAYEDYRVSKAGSEKITGITLGESLRIDIQDARNRGVQENTIKTDLESHGKFLMGLLGRNSVLAEFDVAVMNKFISGALEIGRHANTLKQKDLPLLSRCFRAAGVVDITKHKQIKKLRYIRPKVKAMELDQVALILQRIRTEELKHACPTRERHADILEFFARTAIRSGEFSRIRIRHVNYDEMLITGWGAKDKFNPREILITPELEPVVRRLCESAKDFLVPGGINYINLLCKRWRQRLALPALNGRILRHSLLTAALEQGVPLANVAKLAGHTRVSTTDRYVQSIASRNRLRQDAGTAAQGLVLGADESPDT